jgi:hypothetical protein
MITGVFHHTNVAAGTIPDDYVEIYPCYVEIYPCWHKEGECTKYGAPIAVIAEAFDH